MSREIKFRAWDKHKKKMIFGPTDGKPSPSWVLALEGLDLPIMQYTGKKDKNGKEIWGDDICRAEHCCIACFETEPHILTGTIVWGDGMWMFDYGHGCTPLSCGVVEEVEVIGDIHTNPELLEAPK